MNSPFDKSWGEISPLLDEALELPTRAREAWLEDLQRRAPELAARVGSCLARVSDLSDRNFLEAPVRVDFSAGVEGSALGAYTLDRPLGYGGMGTVWLAHRSDGRFEGQVAVKLLNPAFLGHPSEQRFAREGRVLARLQHPNIARLMDAGVEADHQPYLVLEYVRGNRIDEYCERHRLGIEQRIRLFLDVLAGVAHAHSNLVVHRDIKPSNILVTEQGEVKLLDFGIAALLSRDGDDLTRLTAHVGPVLTPGYASPEQLLGQPITTATDVYSLGIVLFELLAGRHPLSAKDEPKSATERMRMTLEADPPRLSDVATEIGWRRRLRGDLDNIVAMALRKNPAERYRTAEAFAQDLRNYLALEPVAARPRSLSYLAAKFVRRNRTAVASACVVAVAVVVAGAFSVWQMLQANEQQRLAEDQASRAEFSRDFAEFVLTDAGATGRPFTTAELLLRAEQALHAYGSPNSPMVIEQLIKLGSLFTDAGQYRKAQELFETAHDRAIAGHYADLRWQSACQIARIHHYAARLQQSAQLFDTAIAELQRELPDSPALIECFELKSDLLLTREDVPAAIVAAQAAVTQAERIFPRAKLRQIAARVQLGTAHRAAGHLQIADNLHRQTFGLLKDLGRERTANAVLLYTAWGMLKSDMGDIVGAVNMIESAMRIGHALWVDTAPDQWPLLNYGRRLILLHRLDEAERYLTKVQHLSSSQGDAEMEAAALSALIAVYREKGDLAMARAARDSAERFVETHLPPDHVARVNCLFESGMLDLADRSLDTGKTRLEQALAKYQRASTHIPNQIVALAGLSKHALESGDLVAAARFAGESSALARGFAVPGQASYWVGLSQLAQADVERALGHAEPARALARDALAQLIPTVGMDHPLAQKAAALNRLAVRPDKRITPTISRF